MSVQDADIRISGKAGHITLRRAEALNAMTSEMSLAIESALDAWRDNPSVEIVLMDAEGDRAFCAGGDIAELYARGVAGDFAFGRDFWRQEYRLNLKIATYPKRVVTFLQGFTMGGGVGLGCHAQHRIVCESSRIAMPECGIGLIPDVGGSLLLANSPGHSGAYLGLTGARMDAGDAIHAGFADHFIPQSDWPALKETLIAAGDSSAIEALRKPVPESRLREQADQIERHFVHASIPAIKESLEADGGEFAQSALKGLGRGAPLSLACGREVICAAKGMSLREALAQEYRFSYRSQSDGDLSEGIRAKIIDKDNAPKWKHASGDVPQADIDAMLAPLGADEWTETGGVS